MLFVLGTRERNSMMLHCIHKTSCSGQTQIRSRRKSKTIVAALDKRENQERALEMTDTNLAQFQTTDGRQCSS